MSTWPWSGGMSGQMITEWTCPACGMRAAAANTGGRRDCPHCGMTKGRWDQGERHRHLVLWAVEAAARDEPDEKRNNRIEGCDCGSVVDRQTGCWREPEGWERRFVSLGLQAVRERGRPR